MIRNAWNRIRLNLRAVRLAAAGLWLQPDDVAASYDDIAATYDEHWLIHLRQTTDILHRRLPDSMPENKPILELGCGSGYSTRFLSEHNADLPILAVDISPGMIDKARTKISPDRQNVTFFLGDMLDILRSRKPNHFGLVFSAWAIGYSNPAEVIAQSARILHPGGTLAVVVNRLDTMPAVFDAFRRTMRRFPDSLRKAVWPRFPKDQSELAAVLKRSGLKIELLEESAAAITPPDKNRLDWLLGTGVLAGFDQVLPLREAGPVRDDFSRRLDQSQIGWKHHYILFSATKK